MILHLSPEYCMQQRQNSKRNAPSDCRCGSETLETSVMKFPILAIVLSIVLFNSAQADDVIRHNISWSLEGKNDPIVQFTNQGEADRTIIIRLLIGTSSYRYPSDLDVPT